MDATAPAPGPPRTRRRAAGRRCRRSSRALACQAADALRGAASSFSSKNRDAALASRASTGAGTAAAVVSNAPKPRGGV
ncbi:hypothetical protein DIPPA_06104 [Diplonema papillatum]|nr:hypothetical protein DIPPA_06104 [Diplonema papillatum]